MLSIVPCLWLAGCAHYQAGNGTAVPFSSLEIDPVNNQSLAPQANQVVNHDLRETFIQSGKVTVVSANAQALLQVTLTQFDRKTIATNSQDTGLARKYTLTMSANCNLINQVGEQSYFENRPVTVSIDIFLESGQTQAETNAIPILSKKLATAISNEVLQVW